MKKRYVDVSSKKEVRAVCPWAKKIVKVDTGYMAFESTVDYLHWLAFDLEE